jgi:oligo-1,6-glucosidase
LIYQGQELGMENISVSSIEEVDDISALDSYKVSLAAGLTEAEALRLIEKNGRDNARTPYQWSSAPGAGFTTGTPWLRINPNYKTINLEDEKKDPGSVYHYYKKLIALRKDPAWKETLVYGELVPWLADTHNVMAYTRESVEGKILVIANYQTGPRRLPLPAPAERVLLNNYETADLDGQEVFLQGYQVLVLALSEDGKE